jgi:hypothetical protein
MLDRLLAALRLLVRNEIARMTYLGVYEYTVQGASPGTVDASPASSLPLPTLSAVPLLPSILGQTATPAARGALCRIRFANGDPTRPVCVGIAAPPVDAAVDATGTLSLGPSSTVVLVGGTKPVAREGDGVSVFLAASVITGTLGGSTPFTGPMQATTALAGIIASTSRASA